LVRDYSRSLKMAEFTYRSAIVIIFFGMSDIEEWWRK